MTGHNAEAIRAAQRNAFSAGIDHAHRTDLPTGHNVHKFASDRYPADTLLFEAFLRGFCAAADYGVGK